MIPNFRVKAGFGAGFAILLGIGLAAVYQTLAWEESVQWVLQTHTIIATVDAISLHSRSAVEYARIFVQDGDQRNLARTWESLDSVRVRADRLSQTLGLSRADASLVSDLRRYIDREYEVFSLNTTSATRADVSRAIELYERSGLVGRIDVLSDEIRKGQYRQLQVRTDEQTANAKRTRYLFLGAALASCMTIFFAFWRGNSESEQRSAIERALATKDEQYRQVVEDAGDIIYQTDSRGRFTFCNNTALAVLHLTEAEVLGRSYLKMIRHDKRRDAERFYLRQYARRKKHTYFEFPILDGHARERWLGQNVQLLFEGDQILGFQSIARDITERKKAELELERTRGFIEKIAATTPGILYVYDIEQQKNVFSNRELYTVLGYPTEDVGKLDRLMDIIVHPDDLPLMKRHHAQLRHANNAEVFRIEFRARHVDGRWLWLASRDTPFERGADAFVKQIVGIAQDVTQRKSVEEQLEYQANFDALTGLSNRHHFFTRLNTALRRVSIEHSTLSACIMDVDHFKLINDKYGHSAGDEVLQTVGQIVRSEMRSGNMAGRLGGDEFCMILLGADVDEATAVAERVRNRLTTLAFGLGTGSPFSVTATFGVAETKTDGTSRELLERADEALYTAKNQGRNRTASWG